MRWGQNRALFSTFRNLHDPHNYSRKILGFDTFEGFPSISTQDGTFPSSQVGAYSVSPDYESYFDDLLATHERLAPRSHLKKFELVKGDVRDTLPASLESHPETLISFVYFDMDIYEPTKFRLEMIKPYLAKGSVIGFDELGLPDFPGEATALKEVGGLSNYRIWRDPISDYQSFIVLE